MAKVVLNPASLRTHGGNWIFRRMQAAGRRPPVDGQTVLGLAIRACHHKPARA